MKNRTNSLPPFFNYKEEGTDNGYESLQDFFISWTMRCARENLKSENPILQGYAKKLLYALIFLTVDDTEQALDDATLENFEVLNVITKRQIGLIDVVAEVDYSISGVKEKCILSIENKWYSNIRNQQLEKSSEFIRRLYDCKIVDIVLFCDDEKISEEVVLHCHTNKYKYLTVSHLKEFSGISFEQPTDNALFDEYWLNF